MTISEHQAIETVLAEDYRSTFNYSEYRQLVSDLVNVHSTTGDEKTEDLANYTMLNDRRMKRWDKTIKVLESDKAMIQNYKKGVTWLVITESWCGDAAHIMPAINKVAELSTHIEFKIVLRDEHDALMNAFLTNGAKAIPKLIMIDSATKTVIDTFGPRPSVATGMVNQYKATHGQLTPEFKEDLQHWYNKDKGQSTISDLVALLR